MFYQIRHLTKYRYATSVAESVTETRMHPRSDGNQRCLQFHLSVSPRCRVFSFRDYLGNNIHHFDIPGLHSQLIVIAESLVDLQHAGPIPAALGQDAWAELDSMVANGDYWEMLLPSEFAQPTPALLELGKALNVRRRDDPLSVLHEINRGVYEWFDYVPKSTKVDSPIDDALQSRKGVCQDFAHIMTALVRSLRIPCRYVSGYLYHRTADHDRSVEGATHAWVEALLPHLGWVGFDPTNSLLEGDRHIRVAIGRDYSDVPPTKGVYRGTTSSELTVAVQVSPSEAPPPLDQELPMPEDWSILVEKVQEQALPVPAQHAQQQQQQQ
jgi:transglutaminase-like putative cysteine protease